jgi:hypothetical protein
MLVGLALSAGACAAGPTTPPSPASPDTTTAYSSGSTTPGGSAPASSTTVTLTGPGTPSTPAPLASTTTTTAKNLLTAGTPCSQPGTRAVTDAGESLTCTQRSANDQPRWLPS